MRRQATAVATAALFVFAQAAPLRAGGRGRGRGSVYAGSRGSWSRSGNTASWQGRFGNVSGSSSVTRTSEGFDVNRTAQSQSGYSRNVNKDVDLNDRSVDRSSTATNPWGQSASRNRTVQNEGGYASVQGSASTSTGRSASGNFVAGRNARGQPAYSGTVNTKYNGNYAAAGARNPYGGWTRAAAGPYGGRVTTTLPSGYRTTTYYGRHYYTYGGAYYRPYTYGGVHYYYPVPPPYYAYYSSPPVGAIALTVAGITYMVAKNGSYSKKTTNSQGEVVYQSVPAPEGAKLQTLPAERVLVTVSGTTYYLAANTFYRRVVENGQEHFVVVTPPAGVVFVSALPANFKVVHLNTMYFEAGGRYYVPYLSTDGKEMYVMVDTPPQPPGGAATTTAAAAPSAPAPAAAPKVRQVAETLEVPTGTVILVRLASDLSSATANVGDRFQGFLDHDLAANGKLIAPKGNRVYGVVTAVDRGDKMKKAPSISVTLTDLQVGAHVVAVKTNAVSAEGQSGHGGKKLFGGAALGAAIGAIADGGSGAAIGAGVGAGVGGAAAAAGSAEAAVLSAQSMQSFTVAVPLKVDVMTNVAVR
jgi:hypothetical protein